MIERSRDRQIRIECAASKAGARKARRGVDGRDRREIQAFDAEIRLDRRAADALRAQGPDGSLELHRTATGRCGARAEREPTGRRELANLHGHAIVDARLWM